MKRIDGEKVIDELRKSEFITPMGQGFVFTEQAAKIINAAEEIPAEIAPVTITTKERKIEGFLYNNLLLVPCMSTQTAERFGIIWEERKVGE